jgi:hypothetical protein
MKKETLTRIDANLHKSSKNGRKRTQGAQKGGKFLTANKR